MKTAYWFIVMGLLLLIAPAIYATQPTTITLQAVLENSYGPLEGQKQVVVRLYSDTTKQHWEEIHPNVEFSGGACVMRLGVTNPFQANDFNINTPNIRLIIEGEEIVITLNAVPYAVRAQYADSLPPTMSFSQASVTESFTVGTPSLNALLSVLGKLTVAKDFVVSSDILIVTNNRVGIKTLTPNYTLDVQGSTNVLALYIDGSPFMGSSGYSRLDAVSQLSTANSNFIVGDGDNWAVTSGNTARSYLGLGHADSVTFNHMTASYVQIRGDTLTNLLELITTVNIESQEILVTSLIVTQNRIGIGTSLPSANLHVSGNYPLYIGTDAIPNMLMITQNGSIGMGRIPSAEYKLHILGDVKVDGAIYSGTGLNTDDDWIINATLGYVYNANDYIGIGTTMPQGLLHVRGYYNLGNLDILVATQNRIGIGTTQPDALLHITQPVRIQNTLFHITDMDYGLEYLTVRDNGYIGIGTANPVSKFHIQENELTSLIVTNNRTGIGTTTPLALLDMYAPQTPSVSYLQIRNAQNTFFSVSTNGYVGVGTSSPNTYFEVRGPNNITALYVSTAAVGIGLPAPQALLDVYTNSLDKSYLFRVGDSLSTHVVIDPNGYLGIGITNPAGKLHVGTDTLVVTNNRVGIGTTEPTGDIQVMTHTRTGTKVSMLTVTKNQMLIGQGDFNENALLTIQGNVIVNGTLQSESSSGWDMDWIYCSTAQGEQRKMYNNTHWMAIGTTIPIGVFQIKTTDNSTAPETPSLKDTFFVNDYMVGIGTTAPTARLHVKDDGISNLALFKVESAAKPNIIVVSSEGYVGISSSDPTTKLEVGGSINAQAYYVNGTPVDFMNLVAEPQSLILGNDSNRWEVKTGPDARHALGLGYQDTASMNRLGINVSAVQGELHVGSTENATGLRYDILIVTNNAIGIGKMNPMARLDLTATSGMILRVQGSIATQNFSVNSSGFVGIGTTEPFGILDVYSSEGHTLVVTQNEIGIGTYYPESPLHIRYDSGDPINHYRKISMILQNVNPVGSSPADHQTAFEMRIGGSSNLGKIRMGAYHMQNAGEGTDSTASADLTISFQAQLEQSFTERLRLKSNGRLGLGTSDPSANLHVFTQDPYSDLIVSQSGVGIGTLTPQGRLHVRTSADANFLVVTESGIGIGTTRPSANLHIFSNNQETVSVTNNRIGIGVFSTASPNELAHIRFDSGSPELIHVSGLLIENRNGTDETGQDYNHTAGIKLKSYNGQAQLAGLRVSDHTDLGFLFKKDTDSSFLEAMRVQYNGYVGIGTVAPSTNFHVVTSVTRNQFSVSSQGIGIGTTAPSGNLHVQTDTTSNFLVATANGFGFGTTNPQGLVHIYSNGINSLVATNNYIGLGTTNPVGPIDVFSDNRVLLVSQNQLVICSDNPLIEATTYAMYINGNVKLNGSLSMAVERQYTDTNMGLGTTDPQGPLHVVSTDNYTSPAFKADTLVVTSNRLGIGTTKPMRVAQVQTIHGSYLSYGAPIANLAIPNEAVYASYLTTYNGTVGSIDSADWSGLGIYNNNGMWFHATDYSFWTFDQSGNQQNLLHMTSGGRIGIGTTAPDAGLMITTSNGLVLHAVGAENQTLAYLATGSLGIGTTAPEERYHFKATAASSNLLLESTGQYNALIKFKNQNQNAAIGINNAQTGLVLSGVGGDLDSDSNVHMIITDTGKIGIGTVNPSEALELNLNESGDSGIAMTNSAADSRLGLFLRDDLTTKVDIIYDKAQQQAIFETTSNIPIIIQNKGSEFIRVATNGQVGIGESAPIARLHIRPTSDIPLYITSSNGSAILYIDTTGNIAIGQTHPQARFDILETITLNQTADAITALMTVRGVAVSNGDQIKENIWLKRQTAADTFESARIHNGLSKTNENPADQTTMVWWERSPSENIQIWGNRNQSYMALSNGYLGIGTISPVGPLDVNANGAYTMVVTDNRVGIGTSAPGYTLDVNGTLNANNLRVAGSSMMPETPRLSALAELSTENNNFIVGTGSTWTTKNEESIRDILALNHHDDVYFERIGINTAAITGEFVVKSTDNALQAKYDTFIITNNRIGITTLNPTFALTLGTDGGIFSQGTLASGTTLTDQTGTMLIWYPKKAAFRAGSVDGTQWTAANIGNYSIAQGHNVLASGESSVALGNAASAEGQYAMALGDHISASGNQSVIVGRYNDAAARPIFAVGVGAAEGTRANAITVSQNGYIGIGTTAPISLLQIYAPDSSVASLNITGASNGAAQLYMGKSLTAGGGITFNSAARMTFYKRYSGTDTEVFSYDSNTGYTRFNSRVGFKNLTPAYDVDVTGTLNASEALLVNGTRVLVITTRLNSLNQLATDNGNMIVANGLDFSSKTPAETRTNLSLSDQDTVRFKALGLNVDTVYGELHVKSTDQDVLLVTQNRLAIGVFQPSHTPQALLHIHNDTANDHILVSGTRPSLKFANAIDGSALASMGLASAANDFINGTVAGDLVISALSTGKNIVFASSNSEAMRINGNGYLGIGESNPQSKFVVRGNVAIGTVYAQTAAPSNGLIVYGKTGVGTSNPTAQLQVEGSSGTILQAKGTGINYLTYLYTGHLGIGTTSPQGSLHIDHNNSLFVVTQNRVGIGLTNPTGRLTIKTHANEAISLTASGSMTLEYPVERAYQNHSYIGYGQSIVFRDDLDPYYDDTDEGVIRVVSAIRSEYDNPDSSLELAGSHSLAFYTVSGGYVGGSVSGTIAERMRINSQGRLGIGTTTPKEKLDVTGAIKLNGDAESGDAGTLKFYGGDFYAYREDDIPINLLPAWTRRTNPTGIYYTDGNVGIGTSVPQGLLHVKISNNNLLVVTQNQVGIGTTLPNSAYKLHVAGNAYVSNHLHLGPNQYFYFSETAGDYIISNAGLLASGILGIGTTAPNLSYTATISGNAIIKDELFLEDADKNLQFLPNFRSGGDQSGTAYIRAGKNSDDAYSRIYFARYGTAYGSDNQNLKEFKVYADETNFTNTVNVGAFTAATINASSYKQNGSPTLDNNISGFALSANDTRMISGLNLTDIIRRQAGKSKISGGGNISWGVAGANTLSITKELIVSPVGTAGTKFCFPQSTLITTTNYTITAGQMLYLRPTNADYETNAAVNMTVDTKAFIIACSSYTPSSNDIILAVHNSDDNRLYMADGRVLDYATKQYINGVHTFKNRILVEDVAEGINDIKYFSAGEGAYKSNALSGTWYRIAAMSGTYKRANGQFTLHDYINGGGHGTIRFTMDFAYGDINNMAFTLLDSGYFTTPTFTKVRLAYDPTDMYSVAYLEVYSERAGAVSFSLDNNTHGNGWIPVNWEAQTGLPTGYSAVQYDLTNSLFMVADNEVIFNAERTGRIGIGTTEPNARLHIKALGGSSASEYTTEIENNTTNGSGGLIMHNTGGTYAYKLHTYETSGTSGQLYLSYVNVSSGAAQNDNVLVIKNGKVGINKVPGGSYELDVEGNILAREVHTNSDIRLKKNIHPIENALDTVMQLQGVTYEWNKGADTSRKMGFIAQEVETIIPEVVTTDAQGYKAIQYANMVAILTEAIKAQQNEIISQNAKIKNLQSETTVMKKELYEIKVRLNKMDKKLK